MMMMMMLMMMMTMTMTMTMTMMMMNVLRRAREYGGEMGGSRDGFFRSCLGSVGLKTASGAAPPHRRGGSAVERGLPLSHSEPPLPRAHGCLAPWAARACAARGRLRHRPKFLGPPAKASGPA